VKLVPIGKQDDRAEPYAGVLAENAATGGHVDLIYEAAGQPWPEALDKLYKKIRDARTPASTDEGEAA
jgi:hypothetical protein